MTDEQAGKFIKLAYHYMVNGEIPQCEFAMEMALTPFINQWSRDAERWEGVREKRIEAGAKGGKQKVANATKSKQKPPVNVNVNANVSVNANDNVNIEFETFWELYDKKRGDKEKIRKKWDSLSNYEREDIIAYLPKYKDATPDKTYRKDPSTFLNNRAWEDEIIVKGEVSKTKKLYTDEHPELNQW